VWCEYSHRFCDLYRSVHIIVPKIIKRKKYHSTNKIQSIHITGKLSANATDCVRVITAYFDSRPEQRLISVTVFVILPTLSRWTLKQYLENGNCFFMRRTLGSKQPRTQWAVPVLSPKIKREDREEAVPRLRMRGAIPPLPYVFIAWCFEHNLSFHHLRGSPYISNLSGHSMQHKYKIY
jgi:hypothetical protein